MGFARSLSQRNQPGKTRRYPRNSAGSIGQTGLENSGERGTHPGKTCFLQYRTGWLVTPTEFDHSTGRLHSSTTRTKNTTLDQNPSTTLKISECLRAEVLGIFGATHSRPPSGLARYTDSRGGRGTSLCSEKGRRDRWRECNFLGR